MVNSESQNHDDCRRDFVNSNSPRMSYEIHLTNDKVGLLTKSPGKATSHNPDHVGVLATLDNLTSLLKIVSFL